MEVLASVSQSYLTQLWSNDVFQKDSKSPFKTITDNISKNFTIAVLTIAVIATVFWLFKDVNKALNVFTAVLIIACPCAIALAAPFTLGNMLRIFGKQKFYLKNATVVEQLAGINTIIFDKTGTLTTHKENTISYDGDDVTIESTALPNHTSPYWDTSNSLYIDPVVADVSQMSPGTINAGSYTLTGIDFRKFYDKEDDIHNIFATCHSKTTMFRY